jgi:hypothetical protein|tara:strand:+ start:479 stop:676 length:198 start_codon:yes stop_codon:yes gene_type:complete
MGQVKRWGMAIQEACEEAVLEHSSEDEQFDAVTKALKADHWPVSDREIKTHLKKALERTKNFSRR